MRRLSWKARDIIRTSQRGGGRSPQKYPPEILQEIFVHCCGDEYIDFFSHSPIEHEILQTCQIHDGSNNGKAEKREQGYERPQWNTAYVLKAVCKEWRTIVEGTPQLWQRHYLEFQPTSSIDSFPSVDISKSQLEEFSHRYTNMLKHVFTSRSGGMALHIRIGTGSSHPSSQNAEKLRGVFMKPLFHALAEESHRWTTLELAGMPLTIAFEHFSRPPNSSHGPMSLPNLRHLWFDSPSKLKETPILAPRLSKVTISGAPSWMHDLMVKAILTQSQNLTTLVISDLYSRLTREFCNMHFVEALQAVPNLVHLHWQGRFGRFSPSPRRVTTDPVLLEQLLSITMEDSNLDFCRLLSRLISCPKLETLRLLVGEPVAPFGSHAPIVVHGAASSIESIIHAAPLIKNVTVVQCKSLLWTFGTMENVKDPSKFEYLYHSGTKAQFVEALQRDKHWSKLSPDLPLEELPIGIMTLESTTKLRKHIPPDHIPDLTVPSNPLTGWTDRDLHIFSEERLMNVFDFVSFIANDWPRGRTSSSIGSTQLPETWNNLDCLPNYFGVLIHLMEMVRSKQFTSDSCSFTFAAVLGTVDVR